MRSPLAVAAPPKPICGSTNPLDIRVRVAQVPQLHWLTGVPEATGGWFLESYAPVRD
jgi:hypothetical protein